MGIGRGSILQSTHRVHVDRGQLQTPRERADHDFACFRLLGDSDPHGHGRILGDHPASASSHDITCDEDDCTPAKSAAASTERLESVLCREGSQDEASRSVPRPIIHGARANATRARDCGDSAAVFFARRARRISVRGVAVLRRGGKSGTGLSRDPQSAVPRALRHTLARLPSPMLAVPSPWRRRSVQSVRRVQNCQILQPPLSEKRLELRTPQRVQRGISNPGARRPPFVATASLTLLSFV